MPLPPLLRWLPLMRPAVLTAPAGVLPPFSPVLNKLPSLSAAQPAQLLRIASAATSAVPDCRCHKHKYSKVQQQKC
jgi:hypothetical protein